MGTYACRYILTRQWAISAVVLLCFGLMGFFGALLVMDFFTLLAKS